MKPKNPKRAVFTIPAMILAVSVLVGAAVADDGKLPVVRGEKTLATVNGEPITLGNFAKQFAAIHEGTSDNATVRKMDPAEILDRMIKGMLVVQEAGNMGLDEVPEVRAALEKHRDETLRNLLFRDRLRNIRKPDPRQVDRIYRDSVREIKAASVLLDKEEDAKALLEGVRGGGDFAALAAKAASEGKGKGSGEGDYVKVSDLPPEVARIVSGMKAGEVSPVVEAGKKFTILKVAAVRYPEDASKRRDAGKQALQLKRSDALRTYVTALEKKYVKPDRKLIRETDFEAETPGFQALLKDTRPVARIQGEAPVTVGEWAESLNRIFFHGIEQAVRQKRVNSKKDQALDQIIAKRVVLKEARRKKIDRSAEFRETVGEFRDEVLFGAFLQKVVEPESRTTEEEMKAFLAEHVSEYTIPEKVRLDLLVFTARNDAEDAIGKLREGADFQWMRANAPGQADPSAMKEILDVNGVLVPTTELPDGLAQAVAGARKGDLRLHASPKGRYCVVSVRELAPSRPEEFESARGRIEKRMMNDKRRKVLEDWMEKLKKGSRIEVHAQGERLRRLLEDYAWQAPGAPGEKTR